MRKLPIAPKRSLALLCLLSAASMALCTTAIAQNRPPETWVVAVDQSTKMTPSDASYQKTIQVLMEKIGVAGDRVVVTFLNGQTQQIGNQQVFVYEPPGSATVSNTDLQRAQAEAERRRYRMTFLRQVIATIKKQEEPTRSHLLELLPLLGTTILAQYGNQATHLLLLTDLIQNSAFVRIVDEEWSFLYQTTDQTRAAAREHAEALAQRYHLTKDQFAAVTDITVYLPAISVAASQPILLQQYWETVFGFYGMPKPQIIGQ